MRSSWLIALLLLAPRTAAQFTDGYVYVADYRGDVIYEVDPASGNWTRLLDAGDGLAGPASVGFTFTGELLVSNFNASQVLEFKPDLSWRLALTALDGLNGPSGGNGLVIDEDGQIYVANYIGKTVLQVQPDFSSVVRLADASDGIGRPDGLCLAADSTLLVANRGSGGQILQLDRSGNVALWDTILGENVISLTIRNNKDVYVLCENGNIHRYFQGIPASRTYLGSYFQGNGSGAIQFDRDFQVLYLVNNVTGDLRAIDPGSGTATYLAGGGWNAVALAVAGGQYAPGTLLEFGDGLAGAGGLVPSLAALGVGHLKGSITLELRDFLGSVKGLLLVSQDIIPTSVLGGTIYPDFLAFAFLMPYVLPGNLVPGEGDMDLSFTVPDHPALVYTNWYLQAFAFDPLAAQGVSMSNAARIYLGE